MLQPSVECMSIDSSTHSLLELSDQPSSVISLLPVPVKQEFFNICEQLAWKGLFNDYAFRTAVKEWCAAWKLHVTLSEVCSDAALLQDLRSVTAQTKMSAIAVVSTLAENEAMQALKVVSKSLFAESDHTPTWMSRKVSSEIVQALERLLDDEEVHVRIPSAITLYSMDRQTDKVQSGSNH